MWQPNQPAEPAGDTSATRDRIPPNQQRILGERWPVVGERSPRVDDSPWSVTLAGRTRRALQFSLADLQAMPRVTRAIDVHCVTRWSKLDMPFSGVPLTSLIGTPEAPCWEADVRYVSFVARSEQNHSTSLPLADVLELDPLVALEVNGAELPPEHGGPVRIVLPGKYFYKSVKWLERIEFLVEDRLGNWEADAGYHNGADPWLEQRYMATTLTKPEAARLIESRDFRGLDLRGISASQRDLAGLLAAASQLRDADFRNAALRDADFNRANLSNAQLQDADLRGANFAGADLEGANFSGADLRGANLIGASLFGASFCDRGGDQPVRAARFDAQTQIEEKAIEVLVEDQLNFLFSVRDLKITSRK